MNQMKQFYKLLLEGDVPTMKKLIIALLLVNAIIWFLPAYSAGEPVEVASVEEPISVTLSTE